MFELTDRDWANYYFRDNNVENQPIVIRSSLATSREVYAGRLIIAIEPSSAS
ncbi:hypothetical protein [Sphingobium lignivorans]|uniref:Uncharacterized protein n=1 Tax=Sphingobium lignivorans TaxID=2735886 RepID=A0ABR6NDY8_9SPHN|nr:hypothetical protein [Sphingobium lignivorans]MBB5985487.1 hypothetical protein [Sphingobium lignivorans]